MKIVLFKDYGSGTGEYKPINDILTSCDFPHNRMGELVDLLENLPDSTDEMNVSFFLDDEKFIEYVAEKGVVKMKNMNSFIYFVTNGQERPVRMHIASVDTTKPWTVKSYDGSEYIEEFDYEMIDKTINYVKQKSRG